MIVIAVNRSLLAYGLGHLGVQYARRMGFKTVAINRGKNKEALARQIGAHHQSIPSPRMCLPNYKSSAKHE